MKIGIFDSGVGGLTVLKKLIDKHPNHHYIYFGDTEHLPYGEKSKEQLLVYSEKIIEFLITKNVDYIIMACGTISSNVYEEVKNKYAAKIINVVELIVDYIEEKHYKNVGFIGTSMTVKSKNFEKNMNANVISQACPCFVEIIEGILPYNNLEKYLSKYLSKFQKQNIEVLVLGCTHYSLIKKEIMKYFDDSVDIIDLGEVIADKIELPLEEVQNIELFFSKLDKILINNVKKIIGNYKVIEKKL